MATSHINRHDNAHLHICYVAKNSLKYWLELHLLSFQKRNHMTLLLRCINRFWKTFLIWKNNRLLETINCGISNVMIYTIQTKIQLRNCSKLLEVIPILFHGPTSRNYSYKLLIHLFATEQCLHRHLFTPKWQ